MGHGSDKRKNLCPVLALERNTIVLFNSMNSTYYITVNRGAQDPQNVKRYFKIYLILFAKLVMLTRAKNKSILTKVTSILVLYVLCGCKPTIVAVLHSLPTYFHLMPVIFPPRHPQTRIALMTKKGVAPGSAVDNPNDTGKAEAFAISLLALEKVRFQSISRTS